MMEAGETATHAYAMFDQGIRDVLLIAIVRRHRGQPGPGHPALPHDHPAPRRSGSGRPPGGRRRPQHPRPPPSTRRAGQPGRLLQPDGCRARGERAAASRHHRQHGPRTAHATDQPGGLPRGHPRRRHPAGPAHLRVAARRDRATGPTGPLARRPGAGRPQRKRDRTLSRSTWPALLSAATELARHVVRCPPAGPAATLATAATSPGRPRPVRPGARQPAPERSALRSHGGVVMPHRRAARRHHPGEPRQQWRRHPRSRPGRTCSNASTGSRSHATERSVAPASAWPSSSNWWRAGAGASAPSRPPVDPFLVQPAPGDHAAARPAAR